MKQKLQAGETVPGGLAQFEAWLREQGWYDWDVLEFDASTHVYAVDADHAEYFIEQAGQFGVALKPL